jgi:hypothetical protein
MRISLTSHHLRNMWKEKKLRWINYPYFYTLVPGGLSNTKDRVILEAWRGLLCEGPTLPNTSDHWKCCLTFSCQALAWHFLKPWSQICPQALFTLLMPVGAQHLFSWLITWCPWPWALHLPSPGFYSRFLENYSKNVHCILKNSSIYSKPYV